MNKQLEHLRARVAGNFPLFVRFMIDLPLVEDKKVRTIETNGKDIRYNPDFFFERSKKSQEFIYLHELAHNFLGHHLRYHKEWDVEMIQRAADYAVNGLLRDHSLDLPRDALYAREYHHMSMEEIYRELEQEKKAQKKSPHFGNRPEWDKNKQGKLQPAPTNGKEGDKKQKEQQEKEHRQKQQEGIQSARMAGQLPQALERTLDKLLQAKLNWKDILTELLIKSAGKDNYTFSPPNRRYNDGFILPSLYSEETPEIVIAVDTSGSVSPKMLKKMVSEIMGLVEGVEPEEIHIMWCDTRVKDTQVFTPMDAVKLKPRGGGGTDFRDPFKQVEKRDLDPAALIYLTDGFCNLFAPEPSYPTIWVVWQDRVRFKPPYGEVIVMNNKD